MQYDRKTPRKRKEPTEAVPLFLRKLFSLIDAASHTGVCKWAQNGETFIVMDSKEFARTWIPSTYRHNNFSSFIRQLNFYGFRKVKSVDAG